MAAQLRVKVRYAGYGHCYLAPREGYALGYDQCQSSTTSTVVKAPLVRASSLVKRRYIMYLVLPFFTFTVVLTTELRNQPESLREVERSGVEPVTSRLQVRRPNHSLRNHATLAHR